MRTLLLVSLLAGCSSRATEPVVETGAFRFEDVVSTNDDDATVVRVHRREVPLEQLPLAPFLLGLPMSGNANIDIDLVIPSPRLATGTFAITCPKGCTLGDGVAKLMAPRTEGLPFGRLVFAELAISGVVTDGRVELTRWHAVSEDVFLDLKLTIALADNFDDSTLDGCVTFKPGPTLHRREPKTAAVISTTGANIDAAGMFNIAIGGTAGTKKMLAKQCSDEVATGD